MAILRNDVIKHLIQTQGLIEVPEGEGIPEDNIQPASYDLRLGDEYIQNGEKKKLEERGEITIPPFDFVVVGTYEKVNIPSNIAARFQNRMKWAFNGINMAMGAQVDPGYKGKLYCALFNFTNETVKMKYKEHLATIEFAETTKPNRNTKDYSGPWMNMDSIAELYRQGIYPKSALREKLVEMEKLDDRMDKIEGRIDTFYKYFVAALMGLITIWGILSVLLWALPKLLGR
jgi:deoxycytidine triphosphate deaminase